MYLCTTIGTTPARHLLSSVTRYIPVPNYIDVHFGYERVLQINYNLGLSVVSCTDFSKNERHLHKIDPGRTFLGTFSSQFPVVSIYIHIVNIHTVEIAHLVRCTMYDVHST